MSARDEERQRRKLEYEILRELDKDPFDGHYFMSHFPSYLSESVMLRLIKSGRVQVVCGEFSLPTRGPTVTKLQPATIARPA